MKQVPNHSFIILPTNELYEILNSKLRSTLNPYFVILFEQPQNEETATTVHCIYSGQINYVKQRPLQGVAVLFRLEFLLPLKEDIHLAINTGLFTSDFIRKVQVSRRHYQELIQLACNIQSEVCGKEQYHLQLIYAQIKILLIQLTRIAKKDIVPSGNITIDDQLFGEFISLINIHFMVEKKVSFYAQKFSITPNYLNIRIKKMTGYTASYHIQQRIILEAKRKAQWELMNMKQIAYELGFEDISYFSRFFKKYSGISFSDFKKKPVMA